LGFREKTKIIKDLEIVSILGGGLRRKDIYTLYASKAASFKCAVPFSVGASAIVGTSRVISVAY
jgi:hypothetical protein